MYKKSKNSKAIKKPNLLYITYTIDKLDCTAGHVHDWVAGMASYFNQIDVICIRKGKFFLPDNVFVYSLGKEKNFSKLRRILTFIYRAAVSMNCCDVVFCQFSSIFVLSIFPFSFLYRRPVILWWTHKHVDWRLKVALKLVDRVVTASKESFQLPSNKVRIIGHGIDTNKFIPCRQKKELKPSFTVVTVGRLSPVKRIELLIEAIALFHQKNQDRSIHLNIIGGVVRENDLFYFNKLKQQVIDLGIESIVNFIGNVPFQDVEYYYQQADCFINLCETGGLDKAVLEAMSCGLPVVIVNRTFEEVLGELSKTYVINWDKDQLYNRLLLLTSMSSEERNKLGKILRNIVVREHSLNSLCERIAHELKEVLPERKLSEVS